MATLADSFLADLEDLELPSEAPAPVVPGGVKGEAKDEEEEDTTVSTMLEVSDLDHPRGVKKSKKIPPKSGSPVWFLVLFGHPILAGGYDQDTTHLHMLDEN